MKGKKPLPPDFILAVRVPAMKDRRRRESGVSWTTLFWFTLFVVLSCVLLTGFTFSTFRLLFEETFHPVIVSTRRSPAIEAVSDDSLITPFFSVSDAVALPDQALVFIHYPPPVRLFSVQDLICVYISSNSSPELTKSPAGTDSYGPDKMIVRCPLPPRGVNLSIGLTSNGYVPAGPIHRWDSLVYKALIDRDNSTVVFVKGLNLRPERLSDAGRYECVYGWDFKNPKFILRSEVVSIAQEITRCKTPLSVLSNADKNNDSIKVSVRVKGRGTLPSIARLERIKFETTRKEHEMCVCTMLRNQAKFLKEWIIYHAHIGVQRWFIYDNNSDDDIEDVISTLSDANYNISRHVWPWIKTQEAGFAHCALRARYACEWIGFIDVDEFFHSPSGSSIRDVLKNQSRFGNIGEIRSACHSFGPSGLRHVPTQGVTVGYTCRMAAPERHKSIVRPEVLNSSLINVVHHFHLKDGFDYANMDKGEMVINHYKYQVWEVFKEKFYRRVATYVADWQNDQNVGSKDRAPGLGTRAVQPADWSLRFCEVQDTELRDRVMQSLADKKTHRLPWQTEHNRGKRARKKRRKS